MHTLTIKNLDQIQETARQFIKLMGDNTVFAFHGNMGAGKKRLSLKPFVKNSV